MGWKRCAWLEKHARIRVFYLNVIVDASGYDLITGVIERHSQDLVCVLECLDSSFFPDIPQLKNTALVLKGAQRHLMSK